MKENEPNLSGLRVLSLESRRALEMRKLIESHGGKALVAPSMREIPLGENPAAMAFAEELLAGKMDIAIFLTGVGTRILFRAMETEYPRGQLVTALSELFVVARGPKPVAVLREFGVPIALPVPEPNTWRDVLKALDEHHPGLDGKRVALQEYGVSNADLIDGLEARGANVTPVPVYQWGLPEDLGPLQHAIEEIAGRTIDVLLVTSANQIYNLMQVATDAGLAEAVRDGLRHALIVSIGPISSEALRAQGISPDLEPIHPKMGQLLHDAAAKAKTLLREKRRQEPQ